MGNWVSNVNAFANQGLDSIRLPGKVKLVHEGHKYEFSVDNAKVIKISSDDNVENIFKMVKVGSEGDVDLYKLVKISVKNESDDYNEMPDLVESCEQNLVINDLEDNNLVGNNGDDENLVGDNLEDHNLVGNDLDDSMSHNFSVKIENVVVDEEGPKPIVNPVVKKCFVNLHNGTDQSEISSCGKCGKSNHNRYLYHSSKLNLKCHSKRVNKEFNHNYNFQNRTRLRGKSRISTSHKFTEHVKKKRTFSCKYCGVLCKKRSILENHYLRIHNDDRPYKCEECSKAYKKICILMQHNRETHTTEKPYVCSECNKVFTRDRSLRDHRRIHTGEKPYACKNCGKAFTHKMSLRFHETSTKCGNKKNGIVISGGKNFNEGDDVQKSHCFVCDRCGKSFSKRKYLKQHLLIHSNARPKRL